MIEVLAAALLAALALAGAVCGLRAARATARLAGRAAPAGPALPASVLKPLYGSEPGLEANLLATLRQRHAAPFEVLCAVQNPADPAAAVAAAALRAEPDVAARLLRDPRLHGANRKVSQLLNLTDAARHSVLVLADADMRMAPGWLTAVTAPLADPAIGIVTCLYRAEAGSPGLWSRLAALGVDWHFLPAAAWGERMGRAGGCYGATIALRAETLERIGGFRAFAGRLADDHALGAAVRRLRLRVEVSPVLPTHVMTEPTARSLLRHELRWARTLRHLDPRGYLGLGIMHPLLPALAAVAVLPQAAVFGVLAAVLAARWVAAARVDRALGRGVRPARLALLPLRDALSAAVWLGGLWPGAVVWGGRRYRVHPDGGMAEARPWRPAVADRLDPVGSRRPALR